MPIAAKTFCDGQQLKSVILPGDGGPGWYVGQEDCTRIEVCIEGDGGKFGFPWFLVYINDKLQYKISSLHVVLLEYL